MNESDSEILPCKVFRVRDRHGSIYRLEWLDGPYGWSLWLLDRLGRKIGYAHTQLQNEALFLADIHITEAFPARSPWFRRLLAKAGIAPIRPENFRSRGLGSVLLSYLESFAIERGYRTITGGIVDKDLSRWPGLPEWYRKRGYVVEDSPQNSQAIGRLQIRKVLSAG